MHILNGWHVSFMSDPGSMKRDPDYDLINLMGGRILICLGKVSGQGPTHSKSNDGISEHILIANIIQVCRSGK